MTSAGTRKPPSQARPTKRSGTKPATPKVKESAVQQATRSSTKPAMPAPQTKVAAVQAVTVEKPVVQLRLRGDESAWLEYSMRVLALGSTSEALREGLRLLHREASEVEAAENIRAFYQGEPAPLPDGVVPADEADLIAADNSEW